MRKIKELVFGIILLVVGGLCAISYSSNYLSYFINGYNIMVYIDLLGCGVPFVIIVIRLLLICKKPRNKFYYAYLICVLYAVIKIFTSWQTNFYQMGWEMLYQISPLITICFADYLLTQFAICNAPNDEKKKQMQIKTLEQQLEELKK